MDVRSDLTPAEWRELQVLMLDARRRRPEPLTERRLREILGHLDRRAEPMPWPDLRQFAMVVLGGHFLAKALS